MRRSVLHKGHEGQNERKTKEKCPIERFYWTKREKTERKCPIKKAQLAKMGKNKHKMSFIDQDSCIQHSYFSSSP